MTHGVCQEHIIRNFTFEEMLYFVITGSPPAAPEARILRATLVAYISHGITPHSTLAVRLAADTGAPFQQAYSAALDIGLGSNHLGALQAAMTIFNELAVLPTLEAKHKVHSLLRNKQRIAGFGHRYHAADPRAKALIGEAKKCGFSGRHIIMARYIEQIMVQRKRIALNLDGAAAAILLDLGFQPAIASLIIAIGRGPMLFAAYQERLSQGLTPFQRLEVYDLLDPIHVNGKLGEEL